MGDAPPERDDRLGLALLSHPCVQAVRFGTKLTLVWFLDPALFGEAMLAGSLAFTAGHLALLGLDEAWQAARHPGPRLYARLAAVHRRSGLAATALLALAGLALTAFPTQRLLGQLLLGLAPMVMLANHSVLPTALLVRAGRHGDLLVVDMGAVLAFAGATLGSAALGAGSWSLVAGWYANAAVTAGLARRRARPHRPPAVESEDDPLKVQRFGRQLAGADLAEHIAERLDGLAVGFGLGRGALGLYEQAGHVAGVFVQYARQLGERAVQPRLAARHRGRTLRASARRALGWATLGALPLHVGLSLAAVGLARWLPPDWQDAGPVLAVLALASGARVVELVALIAVKAADQGRAVARFGWLRVGLLGAALAVSLPGGALLDVAWAVCAVRVVSALGAVLLAHLRVPAVEARPA